MGTYQPQLVEVGSLSQYLQGFINIPGGAGFLPSTVPTSTGGCRISAINRSWFSFFLHTCKIDTTSCSRCAICSTVDQLQCFRWSFWQIKEDHPILQVTNHYFHSLENPTLKLCINKSFSCNNLTICFLKWKNPAHPLNIKVWTMCFSEKNLG